MKRAVAMLACGLAFSSTAMAQSPRGLQPRRPPPVRVAAPVPAATSDDGKDLRARFGIERAERLTCSADATDQLRGIERAASDSSPEAVQWLAQLARDPGRACGPAPAVPVAATTGLAAPIGATRAELRVALARGLALHADDAMARAALVSVLEPAPAATNDERARDPESVARFEMARRIAALALAQSNDSARVEKLVQLAREGGPSAAAATAALVAFPPSGTASWGRPLTPRAMRLVARLGDRRAAGALLDAASGRDVEARAAALEALGTLGDARVIALALGVKSEDDARLRLAAASALVQLGAPEAARAVEALLSEDSLAARAIPLAEGTHGPGVVRALAARAASAVDPAVRSAAIVALGRDPGADGIEALEALVVDPLLRAEAMDAIARSPSGVAMRSIEKLGADAALRRDAVRAYVVRALVRSETSEAMIKLVDALARAADTRDRAVGAFASIALGRDDGSSAMNDRDPGVRRAAYSALLAHASPRARAALLARLAHEEDPAGRAVLGGALAEGDPSGAVATQDLLSCARAGGADGPVCVLAFAARARATESEASEIDALLASRDPIVRVHVARGLARSADPTRIGRLAAAYAYETEPLVRRAIVRGLGTGRTVPSAAAALAFASRFDPDAATRWTAARVLRGAPAPEPRSEDVAWLRVVDASGTPPPPPALGSVWPDDGVALPVAFDADGDALVAAPAGAARLVLAPTLAAAYVRTP